MLATRFEKPLGRDLVIYQTIQQFPKQLLVGWKLAEELDLSGLTGKKFRRILYAGMGGSSLPADLINDYLWGRGSLQVIRDYHLPPDTYAEDLVLCASFSGNTEETIASLKEALRLRCTTLILSQGGHLKEMAASHSLPFLQLPVCIQPRCATGYFFAATLGVLFRLGLIESAEEDLEDLSDYLMGRQEEFEKQGKEIANVLRDRVPIIYGPSFFQAACRIWKIKFNENAKIQSFYNVFPELNHNEMIGFTRLLMKPTILQLRSKFADRHIIKRMEVMKEILGENIPIFEISLSGNNLLQETFESLAIGDYASYHLAKIYGIDPVPVPMVEEFKKRLK